MLCYVHPVIHADRKHNISMPPSKSSGGGKTRRIGLTQKRGKIMIPIIVYKITDEARVGMRKV